MGQRLKKLKEAKATEMSAGDADEDRISNIPSVICTHILSFVSTKDAVRTSILCRSWKSLWTSVPVLDLYDQDFFVGEDDMNRAKAKFIIFVHRFLMRANPFSIRKIYIRCDLYYDLSVIESWIFLAKELKVQQLDICTHFFQFSNDSLPSENTFISLWLSSSQSSHSDPLVRYGKSSSYTGGMRLSLFDKSSASVIESWVHLANELNITKLYLDVEGWEVQELPQALFLWKTLEVLEVDGHTFLNFPVLSMSFPNLKVLELSETFHQDNVSTSNLISSLPLLEELNIDRYVYDNLNCLAVTSRTLKRLKVKFRKQTIYEMPRRETRINAPSLQYLTIQDEITQYYFLEDLGSVVEAKFDVWTLDNSELPNRKSGAFELLRKARDVEHLSLSRATMMDLLFKRSYCYGLMTFHHLTHLEIYGLESLYIESIPWKLLLQFLKCSPKLESLILKNVPFGLAEEFDATSEQDLPDCLESQLKMIEIGGLSGKEDELKLIGYFLRNSRILKRLSVEFSFYSIKGPERKDFREAILALPKRSTECQIQIR